MVADIKFCVIVLSYAWLAVSFVQCDVSHLRYNRYNNRGQNLRLQRLESQPAPYPASGYRPNREFNLPRDQPLLPLGSQFDNRPQNSNGFAISSGPRRPQLIYNAPGRQQSRFSQPGRGNGPQNSNGFNNLAESFNGQDEFQITVVNQPKRPQNNNGFNGGSSGDFNDGFNNVAQPQQPELLYGAPVVQQPQSLNAFDNSAESQRGQNNYNDAARLRRLLAAYVQSQFQQQQLQQQLEQQQQQQQQQQQRPDFVYGVPATQEQQLQTSNGFNNLAESDYNDQTRLRKLQQTTNGFNNLAESDYNNQIRLRKLQQTTNGFNNLAESDYNNQIRLRKLQQQSQQFNGISQNNGFSNLVEDQNLGHSTSSQHSLKQFSLYVPPQQSQDETQTSRLTAATSSRLIDNREDQEEESDARTAETVTADIETLKTKVDSKKSAAQIAGPAAASAVAPASSVVGYYPAATFSYVQPLSAAYVASVASPFVQQQYSLATPAQLQAAW